MNLTQELSQLIRGVALPLEAPSEWRNMNFAARQSPDIPINPCQSISIHQFPRDFQGNTKFPHIHTVFVMSMLLMLLMYSHVTLDWINLVWQVQQCLEKGGKVPSLEHSLQQTYLVGMTVGNILECVRIILDAAMTLFLSNVVLWHVLSQCMTLLGARTIADDGP